MCCWPNSVPLLLLKTWVTPHRLSDGLQGSRTTTEASPPHRYRLNVIKLESELIEYNIYRGTTGVGLGLGLGLWVIRMYDVTEVRQGVESKITYGDVFRYGCLTK